jgi:hypothetical protein
MSQEAGRNKGTWTAKERGSEGSVQTDDVIERTGWENSPTKSQSAGPVKLSEISWHDHQHCERPQKQQGLDRKGKRLPWAGELLTSDTSKLFCPVCPFLSSPFVPTRLTLELISSSLCPHFRTRKTLGRRTLTWTSWTHRFLFARQSLWLVGSSTPTSICMVLVHGGSNRTHVLCSPLALICCSAHCQRT